MALKARVVSLVVVPLAVLAAVAWRFGGNESPVSPKNKEVKEQGPIGGDPGHLFPISIDGKSGYINGRGEVVIQAEYWSAYEFYGDRGVVWRLGDPYMFEFAIIDRSGKVLTPFYPAEPFDHTYSEGLIPFDAEEGVGFMDLHGNVAVPPKYKFPPFEETGADCYCVFEGGPVDGFHEGFAFVHEGHDVYFIDRTGKRAFDLKIDNAGTFNEGHAPVQIKGKWGLIDESGKLTAPPVYEHVGNYSDGLAPASMDGEHYFFINSHGEKVLDNGYSFAYPFSDGLAAVKLIPGKIQYTYIDTTGKGAFVLPEGASPGEFKEGLVRVQHSTNVTEQPSPNHTLNYSISQTVFYDRSGRIVIKLDPSDHHADQFGHYADDFSHGLAKVWTQDKGRKSGYIDKGGNWVWSTLYGS